MAARWAGGAVVTCGAETALRWQAVEQTEMVVTVVVMVVMMVVMVVVMMVIHHRFIMV